MVLSRFIVANTFASLFRIILNNYTKMKKLLLSAAIVANVFSLQAQDSETVSIGAGYAHQTYYNLTTGDTTVVAKEAYHLAYSLTGLSSTIRINDVVGMELYTWPNGDYTEWANVDTVGMSQWTSMINSDQSWDLGAFSQNMDPSDQFDMGWGAYNMSTHTVLGDSIFVLVMPNGAYKKIMIESLASGVYSTKIADIDGGNETTFTLDKSNFSGKEFAYYNLDSMTALDLEPASESWDLLFTQYGANIPGFGAYPSTGVLFHKSNKGQKVTGEDEETYDTYDTADFVSSINTIGYDWKSINMSTFQWEIADTTLYFVEDQKGNIWKLVFTGFGGSSDGNYEFNKTLLYDNTVSVKEVVEVIEVKVYPNPVNTGGDIVLEMGQQEDVQISVINMNGQVVERSALGSVLDQTTVSTQNLTQGIYLVRIETAEGISTLPISVQ